MTITDFLLARIAEDESVAGPAYSWESPESRISEWEGSYSGGLDIPAPRLRAECAAKRAIMALHALYVEPSAPWEKMCLQCDPRAPAWDEDAYTPYPCPTVRAIAAVYADHPDYQQEWV